MATAAIELPPLAHDIAFEGLYRRYAADVYRYALAVLRNPMDAEDITQTTFLNAYRAMQRGERPEKPQNWLIKIAHNAARTRYQHASRRVREVPLEEHIEQLPVADEDKPDVTAVLDALARLPLNQRAALVMRELEGRTYAEIAETLEVSVSAVETLIFRARKSLRVKVSSVRALSVVQLPVSLANLLEGGGSVVAGGSALLGSGLVFKAAIAIVAGVVATSVGANHFRSAQAAPAALQHVAAPPWTAPAEFGVSARPKFLATRSSVSSRSRIQTVTAATTRPDGARSRDGSAPSTVTASTEAASTEASGSGETASGSSAVTTTQPAATTQVTNTVSTAASSLPVSVPTTTVTTPQLPPTPTVEAPSLPAPPPLPPLP